MSWIATAEQIHIRTLGRRRRYFVRVEWIGMERKVPRDFATLQSNHDRNRCSKGQSIGLPLSRTLVYRLDRKRMKSIICVIETPTESVLAYVMWRSTRGHKMRWKETHFELCFCDEQEALRWKLFLIDNCRRKNRNEWKKGQGHLINSLCALRTWKMGRKFNVECSESTRDGKVLQSNINIT